MRGESKKARKTRSQIKNLGKARTRSLVVCVLAAFAAIAFTFLKVYFELQGLIPVEDIEMVNTGLHIASLALCFVAGPAFMSYLRVNKQIQVLERGSSKKKSRR